MTDRTRIILIVATIAALTIIAFAPATARSGKNKGEIGVATSTVAIPEDTRAARIDAYFARRGMPLAGRGSEFVAAADLYGIDWNLLPAISVAESSGGLHACGFNPFGWGSCRSGVGSFKSITAAIDTVSRNLGGKNPATRSAYAGGTDSDLHAYNGTVDPSYTQKVKDIMSEISKTPLPSPSLP